MKNKKIIKTLLWILVILWMIVIFTLSAQVRNQSNNLSTGITEMIVGIIKMIVPNADFDMGMFNHIVRKNAHFIAYLILGMLLVNVLTFDKDHVEMTKAQIIGSMYAASDEFHQMFVPGRGPQVRDVFIDSAGAFVGIMIFMAIWKIRKKNNKNVDLDIDRIAN